MADLKKIADLYENLLAEAEKFPALFKKLVQPSEQFVEVNRSGSKALREAADATYSRKADVLMEAAAYIQGTGESLQNMSPNLKLIGEIHLRLETLYKKLLDAVSG